MPRGIQSLKVVEMNNRDISLLALLERFDLRNCCGPATRPSRLLCKVKVGKHDVARLMEQDVCRNAMQS